MTGPTPRSGRPAADQVWDNDRLIVEFPAFREVVYVDHGGFAAVYRAHHDDLGEVALKVLVARGKSDETERSRQAFLARVDTETRAIGTLAGHPNVVTLFRSGTSTTGTPYLVMEFCEKGSLHRAVGQRLDAGDPLDGQEIAEVGRSVASALLDAHAAHILHLDVKPANVLIDRHKAFKLSDFGIAQSLKLRGSQTYGLTRSYAPPEMWLEVPQPGTASDVYALGATLHRIATGRHLFRATDEEVLRHMVATTPAPRIDRADLPPDLVGLIHDCLAKSPHDRPRVDELLREFERIATTDYNEETETYLAAGPGHVPRRDAAPANLTPSPPPAPPPWSRSIPPVPPSVSPSVSPSVLPKSSPGAAPPPGEIVDPEPPPADPSRSPALTGRRWRAGLAAVAVLVVAVVVGVVVTRDGSAPLDDDAVIAGSSYPFDPPGATGRSATRPGDAGALEVGPLADGGVELSWTVPDPVDDVDYLVAAATFDVDRDSGAPAAEPMSWGLLERGGGVSLEPGALRRLPADSRSLRVPVANDRLTCFKVLAVSEESVSVGPKQVCAPGQGPRWLSPPSVDVTSAPGVATVSWTDVDGAATRVVVIQFSRSAEGITRVEDVALAAPGDDVVTMAHGVGNCYVVRAENAANFVAIALGDEIPDASESQSAPQCS